MALETIFNNLDLKGTFQGDVSATGFYYDANGLVSGGGATGGGTDQTIFLNDQVITSDFTIPSGKNGMSAGPIQIASGATLTVSPSSVYTVVL